MPLPQTPPTQQGASLLLRLLPFRNPRSMKHLVATLGRPAFIHTSPKGHGHIKEYSLASFIFFIYGTPHFSASITGVITSDKQKAILRFVDNNNLKVWTFIRGSANSEGKWRTSCSFLPCADFYLFFIKNVDSGGPVVVTGRSVLEQDTESQIALARLLQSVISVWMCVNDVSFSWWSWL